MGENIILRYNLVRLSYLFAFALCFLIGFVFMEKGWVFITLMSLVTIWFFISNISFLVKQKSLYIEEKRKQKLYKETILDQEI